MPESEQKLGTRLGVLSRRFLYSGRLEVTAAIVTGVAVTALTAAVEDRRDLLHFVDRADFLAFLAGIGSTLALVSSLTFGFLLYYMQAVTGERYLLYARFKEDVRDLRAFLDELHADGLIDDRYDFEYGLLEEMTLRSFPALDFGSRVEPVLDLITVEQHDELEEAGEFGRVLRGVAYRINDMEETSVALTINWLKHTSIELFSRAVTKSFMTLAIVILTIIVTAISYDGAMSTVLFATGIALAAMTLELVLEIGLLVSRQAEMLVEETAPERYDEADEGLAESNATPSGVDEAVETAAPDGRDET